MNKFVFTVAVCAAAVAGAAVSTPAQAGPFDAFGRYSLGSAASSATSSAAFSTALPANVAGDPTFALAGPNVRHASAAVGDVALDAASFSAADVFPAGQDRSWGMAVGATYGALTLRGAHQNRHVAQVRLYDRTGVSFDASNALAAASYRLGWGTAYAAYSASRGWGSAPLYNPDNPYSANVASTGSQDSRDMLAGVAVPLTRCTTLLASLIHKNDRELANRDANQLAIGASHALSRSTDFYAAYSHMRMQGGASYFDAGRRSASSALNLGMRHAF